MKYNETRELVGVVVRVIDYRPCTIRGRMKGVMSVLDVCWASRAAFLLIEPYIRLT